MERRLVEAASRRPRSVAGMAALVTALLLFYTAGTLRLDTNPARLLDPNLPYLKTERALKQAFPQMSDSIVVVVDGDSPGRASAAARRIAARLRQETRLVESVYAPGESEFFARNGLLYLDLPELEALTDRLSEAAPYLGTIAQDPTLRGLFDVIGRSLDENMTPAQRGQLAKMLGKIADTVEAQLAGRAERIAWSRELAGGIGGAAAGSRQFIVARPRFDFASFNYGEETLEAVRRLVHAEAQAEPGVRARLTGEVPMDAEELASVEKEMIAATALSFALVVVLLFVALRSIPLVLAVVATLLVGLAWTAAFAAFAIGHLNLISVSFAVLFIGFGVDFGIQFALRYREELRRGDAREAAIARAGGGAGPALTLAAATAAAGFFSFAPTSYRGLAELGIIAGASMFLGLFANLTVLPALLRLFYVKPLDAGGGRITSPNVWDRLARHRRAIVYAAGAAALASGFLVPQARFDFNPLNMKDPTTESVATFIELLRDPDATPYTIELLAPNVNDAANLAAQLEKLPVVAKAVTLSSFVPANQPEKLALVEDMQLVLAPLFVSSGAAAASVDDEARAYVALHEKLVSAAAAAHPDRSDAEVMRHLASALERLRALPGWPNETLPALRERIVSDLPQQLAELGRLLHPTPVTVKDVPPDTAARYAAPDGRARIEVFPKENLVDNDALRRFVREVQGVAAQATGAPVALLEGGDAVIEACLEAALLALVSSLVLLAIVLRRARDVMLVMVPMALAALLTTATSVLCHLPFNLANVIALPLLVTMTIAYSIYLVMRERAQNDLAELLHSSTPRAVLFSALTTAVAFGSMAFSAHRGMASMGLLLAVSLGYSLVCTLVVLPALLALRPRRL